MKSRTATLTTCSRASLRCLRREAGELASRFGRGVEVTLQPCLLVAKAAEGHHFSDWLVRPRRRESAPELVPLTLGRVRD